MGIKATNLSKYRGDRIYVPTSHAGIKKILIWDKKASQYLAPEIGKKYLARKQVMHLGKAKTINKAFDSLRECLDFRQESVSELLEKREDGPTIGELIKEYQGSASWALLTYSTQVMYEGLFERWFDLIHDVPIRSLDAARVSEWIRDLKKNVNRFGNAGVRKSFRKEYDLLKSLLTWYQEYKDDPRFVSPIRKRHVEEYWLDQKAYLTSDENFDEQVSDEIPLTEDEYRRFKAELVHAKYGDILSVLADVQYDHSLRVCEVAALMWSDVKPRSPDWAEGEIKFQRHIQYMHRARDVYPDRIVPGLKNKRAVKRSGKRFKNRESLSKTHPFFPRSIAGLKKLYLMAQDKAGLVFVNPETGSFFTYRCIKDRYDRAFKRAGLPYVGTHIVRYGGVNNFIERYGADEETAMELLGNKSEGRYVLRKSRRLHSVVEQGETMNAHT